MADLKTVTAELKRGEVVFFLGAGMSKAAGLPTAPELAEQLPADFKPPDVQKPTLAEIADYCEAERRRSQLNTQIRELVKAAQDRLAGPSPVHVSLARLRDVTLVVTTNWDMLLERACDALDPRRPYYAIVTDADLAGRPRSPDTLNIMKIHGTLDSPSSYIISEDDLARFKREHPGFYRRLENLFLDQTMILVGYGLGDENVKRAYNDVRFEQRIPRQVYAVDPYVSKSRMGVWRSRNVEFLCDGAGKPYDALAFFGGIERELAVATPVSVAAPTIPLAASRYLTYLIDALRPLTFQGIVQLERAAVTLHVEDLYVKLYAAPEMPRGEMVEQVERRGRGAPEAEPGERGTAEPIRIEDALRKQQSMVVLGHPGSGKTTLLRYLAVIFAQGRAQERLGVREERVPFLVPLVSYSTALRQAPDLDLLEFIPRHWRTEAMTYNIAPLLREHLAKGTALVLLDGLDEVFESAERRRVVERVKGFYDKWKTGNRFVVTSRIIGYRDAPLDADGVAHFTLQDFTDDEIRWFAENWWSAYIRSIRGDTAVAREEAAREAERLTAAIFRDPGVRSLARNPLLLTILALIHYSGKELPQKRVELYELYVKTLITSWSRYRSLAREALGGLEEVEAMKILAPLALWMHREHPAGTAPRVEIERQVQTYYARKLSSEDAEAAARGFVDSVRKYTGLLVERGENAYGLLHLTFEEYLAARGAIFNGQVDRRAIFGALRPHLYLPAWREVVRLAAEHLSIIAKEEASASLFIRNILEDAPSRKEDRGRNAVLAGACLVNIGAAGVERKLWEDTREALHQTTVALEVPAATRGDAGITLGELGWLPADLDEMVPVGAGRFLYGDSGERREIPYRFEIGKYPVTNAQFKQFMLAGGYSERRWWLPEGWEWREKESWQRPRFWEDARFGSPLQPVVGVSWYEAEAYCNWLKERTGKEYRLPIEEEWEKAARGTKGNVYPWGTGFDKRRANTSEGGAGGTTPVMMYPHGASPFGAFDMAGNVWEWCTDWYQEGRLKSLRGGSWHFSAAFARSAYRILDPPDHVLDYVGFRCVAVPQGSPPG